MSATVLRADARHLPIADSTVDLVVTSPPYFGLRSYQDGGEHYAGQIGDEPTPAEFVGALLDVTRECVRVLKPAGSLWVNLGDKYAGSNGTAGGSASTLDGGSANARSRGAKNTALRGGFVAGGAPAKSLIGVPWRYALACIDDLGLILRAEVIWSKPNGLPESVTDRVRRSHEQWFHFTLQPRYFSAVDEVREQSSTGPRYDNRQQGRAVPGLPAQTNLGAGGSHLTEANYNPLGKLPGSVWTIPTQPLQVPSHLGVDHFAAFPMEWPRRIVRGWSPSGICVECGEGRRPVAEQTDAAYADARAKVRANKKRTAREEALGETFGSIGGRTNTGGFSDISNGVVRPSYAITGEACVCPTPDAPTRPATVLDPFGGTGTTALVASALGRHGISVDRSADYCRLAQWRTTDPGQRAAAMQVEKPPTQIDGQLGMFDQEGAA